MISADNLSVCGRKSVCGFVRGVMYIDINGVYTVSTVLLGLNRKKMCQKASCIARPFVMPEDENV